MAEQVADLAFRVFGIGSVKDLIADIESHTEEFLRARGEESLLHDQISFAIDESDPEGKFAEVRFTCKSKPALYACREVILPWLAEKYKIMELAPEYSLEPDSAEAMELTASGSTAATADSAAGGKSETPAPFPSFKALMNAHTELLTNETLTDDSTRRDFLESVKKFINRGTVTGTRLDDTDERRTAQSLLNYWVTVLYRAEETPPPDAILAYYVPPTDVGFAATQCPYLGLSPFQETDRERFFGRDQITSDIVERLREKRLIVLVGPSGGGKTSVLNAGVLPALKEGTQISESKDWVFFPAIAPGVDPLVQLASLFTEEPTPTAAQLLKNPGHLVELLKERNSIEKTVVLIIDQFEELFTVCKDDQNREAFINCFLNLKDSTIEHRVILSMRSDRLHYIIRQPILNELFRDAEIRISPPGEADLRAMIELPAQNIGLKFQPGIVDQLIRELLWDPVGLPLMQFTLLELWADRECDTISWAALNRVGNSRQALCNKAESFYQSLTSDQKRVARRILLRMVRLSETWEATTEPVRREDLYQLEEDKNQVNLVLSKLIEMNLARISNVVYRSNSLANGVSTMVGAVALLSPDHQFELAHESLARSWPEIVSWLKRLREAMVTRQRLELFAANWVILGRGEKALLDKYQLHQAQTWLASDEAIELGYDPDLVALVSKSAAAVKHEHRVRKAWQLGFVTIILLALVIAVALARYEHRRLKEATSLRLAVQASAFKTSQLDLALLLILEAYNKDQSNVDARKNLMSALTYGSKLRAFLHRGRGRVKKLAFNAEGTTLSVLDSDGTATLWDATTYRPVGSPFTLPKIEQTNVNYSSWADETTAVLSHDGRQLAKPDKENSLGIWDIATGTQQHSIPAASIKAANQHFLFSFSDDNRKMAWLVPIPNSRADDDVEEQYELTVWDVVEQKKIKSVASGRLQDIAFSPDNQMLATANFGGEITLLRANNLKPMGKPLADAYSIWGSNRIVFSKDGKKLAAVRAPGEEGEPGEPGELAVWDLHDHKELGSFMRRDLAAEPEVMGEEKLIRIESFDISNDGKTVVASFADSKVILWSVEDGARTELPTGHDSTVVSSITFSADNKVLAAASDDGTIVLWDLERQALKGENLAAPTHGSVVAQIFSDDGRFLYSRNQSDEIVVFDAGSKKVSKTLDIRASANQSGGSGSQISNTVFNKKGTKLVIRYSDDTIAVWDLQTGEKQVLPAPKANIAAAADDKHSFASIATDAAGTWVAAGDENGKIVVWRLDSTHAVTVLNSGEIRIIGLAFNSDGTSLASSNEDGDITIWDTEKMKRRFTLDSWSGPMSNLSFTDDGKNLLFLSERGALVLLDASEPEGGKLLAKSGLNVSNCTTSPDGSAVACVGNDRSIIFWDLDRRQQQFAYSSGGTSDLVSLAYAPDGNKLAAGYTDGSVCLLDVSMKTWEDQACRIANRNLTAKEWTDYNVSADQGWRKWLQFWKDDSDFYSQRSLRCPSIPKSESNGSSSGH